MTAAPSHTSDYARDRAPVYAESCGENAVRNAHMSHFLERDNIFIAEFPDHHVMPPVRRMEIVVNARDPLKVCGRVIGFHQVDVIDLREVCRIWDEGRSNKSVNRSIAVVGSGVEEDGSVTSGTIVLAQNFTAVESEATGLASAIAIETTNASEVADLVEWFEFGDCNGSPLLNDFGTHAAGRPSGYGGLAVKNPSRAPTLGGFAIIAAASDVCNRRLPSRSL